MPKTYDEKCEELARHFLQDYEPLENATIDSLAAELADEIQCSIEDWLDNRETDGELKPASK